MSRSAATSASRRDQIAGRVAPSSAYVSRRPSACDRLHRHPGQRQRRRQRLVEVDHHPAARAVPGVQVVERAVVHDPAVVDDDQPPAQPLDVGQVVRGQHQRGVAGRAQLGEERAHRLLAHHVEPDRRLVEEQHLRPVQQRGGQLAAHPLAERELPHRDVEERVEVEQPPAAAPAGRRGRRPAPGRCAAAARTSRAAAGPTRAASAGRRPRRSAAPAACAAAPARARRPAPAPADG